MWNHVKEVDDHRLERALPDTVRCAIWTLSTGPAWIVGGIDEHRSFQINIRAFFTCRGLPLAYPNPVVLVNVPEDMQARPQAR